MRYEIENTIEGEHKEYIDYVKENKRYLLHSLFLFEICCKELGKI